MVEKKMQRRKKEAAESAAPGEIRFSPAVPAEVKEIIARGGTRGDLSQVMCLILDGRDKNKTIRRNVRGPVRLGDILLLTETEIEAQRLGGGKRRKKK
jgi:small subunit ribosomal protein S28e